MKEMSKILLVGPLVWKVFQQDYSVDYNILSIRDGAFFTSKWNWEE